MYANANNLKSWIISSVSASATTVSITSWEGVLWSEDTVACLEHYDNEICTKREIVKITSITDDTLTITRSFAVCVMNDKTKEKGDTAFTFEEWDFLSMYLSKELRESLTEWVGENQTAYETMLENLAVPRTCINNCLTTRQSAIDTAYRTKFWGLAWFWNGSDGDCIISEDTFLDAWREYNFRNLTICPDVLVRFEGAGVPTINVRDKFCNLWTIELKAPYVSDSSILECWCSCWKELCNKPTDWGACCGGAGGTVPTCDAHKGYDGCPWTADSWWYGGGSYCRCWPFCPIWWAPDWLNWWRWGDAAPATMGYWWGWGWWWGWRWGNWWHWGMGWRSDTCLPRWWDWWNSWLYWTGWKGWEWWRECCHSERYWYSWNWWNGYYWWEWWESYSCYGGVYAWTGWKWVIKWWTWWCARNCCQSSAWQGGDAITNVYWFHLNARNIWNNCVNARWWEWGEGWRWIGRVGCCALWWIGWNGANGWQMIINYRCIFVEWCFDVRGGAWWRGWWSSAACSYAQSWEDWKDWRKIMYALNEPNITNTAIYTFGDTKLYREDPHFVPSANKERWKTLVVYSTEDFPTSPEEWTLLVESTVQNQYKDSPFTVALEPWTYYFSLFSYDSDETPLWTFQEQITIIWWIHYAIVWGGGGWWSGICNCRIWAWWWWAGWVLMWTTCIWWDFDVIIGCWWLWATEIGSAWWNWWNTCFWREIAYWWGWGWWFCQVWCDWWAWWWWSCNQNWWTWYYVDWIRQWYNWGKWCLWGAWGWWSGTAGCWGTYAWSNWWAWKCFCYNPACCSWCTLFAWWWWGWACWCLCLWWCWCFWWGNGGWCGWRNWCNATLRGAWWWWGGWSSSDTYFKWWNWSQWVVYISYCCTCPFNIQWWDCCFTCYSYKVHRFDSDWKLCIL